MNKIVKYTLIVFGLNIALGLVLSLPAFLLKENETGLGYVFIIGSTVIFLSFLVQLILGIIFAAGERKKDIGKAMLLSIGIFLVIGAGVCGGSYMGLF